MSTATEHAGPWIPEWTLADRLRKARLSVKLGQREFAAALGVSAPTYSQWEAGNARPRDLVAIAKRIEMLTRVPAAWLLGVDDVSTRPNGPGGADGWAPWGSNPRPAD
jgi:transcriptional regulator with XRE-family HTH domain